MKIKFWGVRGSLPSTQMPRDRIKELAFLMRAFFKAGHKEASDIPKFLSEQSVTMLGGYGFATTCIEVQSPQQTIIIDGGSGIKTLSDHYMRSKQSNVFHLFLTHFHWDHLLGLPFFAPHFIPGYTIHYYAVQPELEEMIRGKFRKPYFPVAFDNLGAEIHFHILEPRKTFVLKDMEITPYQLDHPDPCWGFRIELKGDKKGPDGNYPSYVYSHCVDTEGTRVNPSTLGPDLPLYQNVDLMYFDAQYTLPELVEKMNWGHSAAQIGLDLAFRENIRHVIFGHHDPGAGHAEISALKNQTQDYYEWKLETAQMNHQTLPSVKWKYAYEGLEIDLTNLKK